MANWEVKKYVRKDGSCPFDEWYESNALTDKDRTAIDAKVGTVEQWGGPLLPPETWKKYQNTNLHELKVRGDRKQLRPLGVTDGQKKILILYGAIEKGNQLPKGDLKTAENLLEEYKKDIGYVKSYHENEQHMAEVEEEKLPRRIH